MTYSIYHFFKSLVKNKEFFTKVKNLDSFPFDESMLSCKNVGIFPDMAIKLNKDKSIFTGGELIELKDSVTYSVSSFNSTVPSRSKEIAKIIKGEKSKVKQQMIESGDEIYSLSIRDVFYLVRGRHKDTIKVCLVYGSFFETIKISDLISESFSQVLDERLKEKEIEVSDEFRQLIKSIFSQQENFSKVRTVEKASVKLRFRIMTEVKAEGNILDPNKYPEIKDDTLNFLLPCHNEVEEKNAMEKFRMVFGESTMKKLNIFKLKHHFNGYFLVFQIGLK